jgi:hypothetical protein
MIIDSPVGRFPFTATRVRIRGGRIRLEGAMGTWPTSVDVGIGELPGVVGRLLPVRNLAALAGLVTVVAVTARLRRRDRP